MNRCELTLTLFLWAKDQDGSSHPPGIFGLAPTAAFHEPCVLSPTHPGFGCDGSFGEIGLKKY